MMNKKKAYGLTSKGNGEAWITLERHMALSVGGGQAGQGFPCVLIVYEQKETDNTDRKEIL